MVEMLLHYTRGYLEWYVIMLLGFVVDYLVGVVPGMHAVALLTVGLIIKQYHRSLIHCSVLQQILFSGLLLCVFDALLWLSFLACGLLWSWQWLFSASATTLFVWCMILIFYDFHRRWFSHVE